MQQPLVDFLGGSPPGPPRGSAIPGPAPGALMCFQLRLTPAPSLPPLPMRWLSGASQAKGLYLRPGRVGARGRGLQPALDGDAAVRVCEPGAALAWSQPPACPPVPACGVQVGPNLSPSLSEGHIHRSTLGSAGPVGSCCPGRGHGTGHAAPRVARELERGGRVSRALPGRAAFPASELGLRPRRNWLVPPVSKQFLGPRPELAGRAWGGPKVPPTLQGDGGSCFVLPTP